MLQVPTTPNFTSLHPTASRFRLTGHFETSALNDPKETLNTKRPKVLYTGCISTLASQFSLCFALPLAIFELQAILRQVRRITPKWPWTLLGQRYPIYMWQLPPSPKFQSVSLYRQPFARYTCQFETSAPNHPKVTINTKWKQIPHIHVTTVLESQIPFRFALRLAIFELQAILKQVHQMTPKWPWTLNDQKYPNRHVTTTPSSKFHSISV